MNRHLETSNRWLGMASTMVVVASLATFACAPKTAPKTAVEAAASTTSPPFRAALLAAAEATAPRFDQLRDAGMTSIVLVVGATSPQDRQREIEAAERIRAAGFELGYWVEVARCPELADAHPEWMASLQTHDEWRRFFPESPKLRADEVAKTYPWVPMLSRETFAAQLTRVKAILIDKPPAASVFLNDLQGAPSACGCGNPLCRWTSDYGKKRTTIPLDDDAAALFTKAVQKTVPDATVIPVWTTECEQHDGAADGLCAGVGCFDGICWKAYTKQLMPLQQSSKTLGVLLPFREFQRDRPFYGESAGWVRAALESFAKLPPRNGGTAIPASRLIAVVQGWDVSADDIAAQIKMANAAGARGYVVAFAKLDQSWQPQVIHWP